MLLIKAGLVSPKIMIADEELPKLKKNRKQVKRSQTNQSKKQLQRFRG
jgi:hypothetical protein